MDPPLRERVRWRNATDNDVERPATRANMARTAALLSAAGALVCLIAVLVPGEGHGVIQILAVDELADLRLEHAVADEHQVRGWPSLGSLRKPPAFLGSATAPSSKPRYQTSQ